MSDGDEAKGGGACLPTSMLTHVVSVKDSEDPATTTTTTPNVNPEPVQTSNEPKLPPSTEEANDKAQSESAVNKFNEDAAAGSVKKDHDPSLRVAQEGKKGPPARSVIIRADGAPDIDGSSSTMFILDLVRQRREKVMRKKKDDMINEMALKKKRQMEEAKRKGKQTHAYSFGGFVGVGALVKPTKDEGKSPRVQRKATIDEVVAVPSDSKSRAIFENSP